MWKASESTVKPLEVDATASKHVVYIRRNIKEVAEAENEDGNIKPTHWEYEELQIPKDSYDNYSDIQDLQEAVVELASIIAEV